MCRNLPARAALDGGLVPFALWLRISPDLLPVPSTIGNVRRQAYYGGP